MQKYIYYRNKETEESEFIENNFSQTDILEAVDKYSYEFEEAAKDEVCSECSKKDCSECEELRLLHNQIDELEGMEPEYKLDLLEKAYYGGRLDIVSFLKILPDYEIDKINKDKDIHLSVESKRINVKMISNSTTLSRKYTGYVENGRFKSFCGKVNICTTELKNTDIIRDD